ncbi:MAG: ornithine cyclodeaminase family protein [Gammaproteobacteria bacterium]|nr:ornithine cyclodeaminase family protein [Gammaproteobacteria bacterium]
MSLRVLDSATIRNLLPMSECIDLMRSAMIATSSGNVDLPVRSVASVLNKSGLLAQMPGASKDLNHYGIKLLSIHASNPGKGLPAIQGVVLLFESTTGKPVAILEAAEITAIRTAAASGLATGLLARETANTCGIFGNGVLAASHIEAIKAVRPIKKFVIWGRNADKTANFAEQQQQRADCEVIATSDPVDAARCDVVCTVTAAKEPILMGSWVKPGAHINLVGAHSLTTREADSELVTKAALYVDSIESTLKEGGDIMIPIEEGAMTANAILGEVGQLLSEDFAGRASSEQITVYKSHGIFTQDLYAANYVLTQAINSDAGIFVEDF